MKVIVDFNSFSSTNHFKLVEVRMRRSDFDTDQQYIQFREYLINKAINPWLMAAYQSTEEINGGLWAIIIGECNDGKLTVNQLLDYEQFTVSPPNLNVVVNFKDWVVLFNPQSRGDWLMAPVLYKYYLRNRHNPNEINPSSCPWIDALLSESRGRLMWSYQAIEIIRMAANVSRGKAAEMFSNFLRNRSEWEGEFEKFKFPYTDITLQQIFKERTVLNHWFGNPDYILTDWLECNYASYSWTPLQADAEVPE